MIFWSRVINHNKINRGMVRGEKDWVVHTLKADTVSRRGKMLLLFSLTLSWALRKPTMCMCGFGVPRGHKVHLK